MITQKKILVIDRVHSSLFSYLKGFQVDYLPEIKREEVKGKIKSYHGLILRSKIRVDKSIIDSAPNLEFIARSGSGMDNIDLEAARVRSINCINAAEGNRDSVAEHALGLLLNLSNNINKGYGEVKNGIWDREGNRGFEIKNKCIGIYGFGNTGSAFANLLTSFGCKILAYDKYKSGFGTGSIIESTEEQLLQEADVVSFHIPLTKETNALINKNFINRMSKSIVLLNTSRGKIMLTKDILDALKQNKIIGFGTDVLEEEKLESQSIDYKNVMNELFDNDRVVITPHIAGWTIESYQKLSIILGRKIQKLTQEKIKMEVKANFI